MKYQGISKTSLNNGEGLRAVLWVSGCSHRCAGCQNKDFWNANMGLTFTEEVINELIDLCERPFMDGLTLSGGDPMYVENRVEVYLLCRKFKERLGDKKTIWMYTGYLFEEIKDDPVMKYVDVVVDGPYQKDRDAAIYRGSDNQRIFRKRNGEWEEADR